MNIRREILELNDELIRIRRDLHMHPELGFEEFRTADIIDTRLTQLGLQTRRLAKTGVVAVLEGSAGATGGTEGSPTGGPAGPTLMLRADIDALPVQEENDVPYKSLNDGIMHACGHDAHTAMLLIAAEVLVGMRDRFSGTIKFLFQPNEEVAGAEIMVQEGCLENPAVDAAMGVHIWSPLPSGTIGATAGGVMASMGVFTIVIRGRGGHTGYPELAVDPIIAAADVIQTTQRLQTRDISLLNPTALVFSKIHSGTKNNIIPDEVVLEGSLRYLFEPTEAQNPFGRFEEIVRAVCAVHKCECEIEILDENQVVVNAPEMVQLVRECAAEILDDATHVVDHRSMAGEDFAAYAKRVPSIFAFVGTANRAAESDFPHHSSRFNVDEETLPIGVELFVRTALRYFEKQGKGGISD